MEVKELIDYDLLDGSFYILKNNTRYRKIFPNEDGYLVFYRTGKRIKEAHKNLSGYLKIKPHPKDMFSYLLIWKENAKNRTLVVQDVVMVKRAYNKLQLKYAKILSKYCVFD